MAFIFRQAACELFRGNINCCCRLTLQMRCWTTSCKLTIIVQPLRPNTNPPPLMPNDILLFRRCIKQGGNNHKHHTSDMSASKPLFLPCSDHILPVYAVLSTHGSDVSSIGLKARYFSDHTLGSNFYWDIVP